MFLPPYLVFFVVITPLFFERFGTLGGWIVCLFELMTVGFSKKRRKKKIILVDEFKRISNVETSKEAWDILKTTIEGTKAVKNSNIQMLTTRFRENYNAGR